MNTRDKLNTIRSLGFTVHVEDGEYRILSKGAPEASAYYTDDVDDALATAQAIAARPAVSQEAAHVLARLRENAENPYETREDGSTWASVYLDNARPFHLSPRQFAGLLSALQNAGLYERQGDNCFGLVKLTAR